MLPLDFRDHSLPLLSAPAEKSWHLPPVGLFPSSLYLLTQCGAGGSPAASQDPCALTPLTCQEGSDCYQPYNEGKFPLAGHEVDGALNGAYESSHFEGDETPPGLPGSRYILFSAQPV